MTAKQLSATLVLELYKKKIIPDRYVKESLSIIEKQLKNITFDNRRKL